MTEENQIGSYSHILLATNGSTAGKAETHALFMAKTGIPLTVLHILDDNLCHYGKVDTLVPSGTGEDFSKYVLSEQKSAAKMKLGRFIALARDANISYELLIRPGNPAGQIAKTAEKIKADLILLGGKHPGGLVKFRGTADKLAGKTSCTIMVIT